MVLICFDLDNTLLKSDTMHIEAFNLAFKDFHLPKVSVKELKKRFGLVGKYLVKDLFPLLSMKDVEKVINRHDYYIIHKSSRKVKVIKGAKKILGYLKSRGYKLALVSNCKHIEIEAILKAAKIDKRIFSVLVGNDEVAEGKPAPDELLKVLKITKAKWGWMVGDTPYDVRAGKKAGFRTISVVTGNHSRKVLKKEKPDFIFPDITRLKKIF